MSVTHDRPVATTTVGHRGRIILPVAIQRAAHIHEGTRVHLRVLEDGGVIIETTDDIRRRLKFRLPAGVDLSADDRAEADEEQGRDAA
ncbi:AbrB/MazE/SpoVT family DNA-binding domain-containing protein [Kitasatospora acidiphila]|uniref:AbrB/MazE/SpoVT family DNA-binding domain-containing protein n=1 Tax=Kitasatospora acidiphila TaxID=2567942 RepID=A0A540W6L8_9ACTN|nr:AbrB/MazE/SpoVT family DNA-binding domain-containing protein [Kitasatospora acidiphila]TQF04665.1 AbrB/MazE/SpoVT family DNA-binding domain-containing protein [Kitasatospora acidiphila]